MATNEQLVLPSDAGNTATSNDTLVLPSDASPQANPAQPKNTPTNNSSALDAAMDGFNRSFGRMAEGVLQIGANLVGATDYANKVKAVHDDLDTQAAASAKEHPVAGGAGSLIGNIARSVPAAIATGGGSVMGQIGAGAATNMGMEGLEYAPDAKTRADKMALGAITGGVGTAAGMLLGGAIKQIGSIFSGGSNTGFLPKIFTPGKAAVNTVANEVDQAGGITPDIVARGLKAKNAGVTLSPAQQIGTKSAKVIEEGIIPQSSADKGMLMSAMEANTNKLTSKLDDTIDAFTPAGKKATEQASKNMYAQLKNINLTPEQMSSIKPIISEELYPTLSGKISSLNKESLSPIEQATLNKAMGEISPTISKENLPYQNQTISRMIRDLNNTPQTEELSKLPLNNAYKLNSLKKEIDNELYTRTGKSTISNAKPLGSTEKAALIEARDKLTNILTEATRGPDGVSTFAEANKLAQQLIMQKNVTKDISEINLLQGQDKPTLGQIHQKLFSSPAKKAEFLDMVKTTGGDPKITSDLIDTLHTLKNDTIGKVAAKEVGQTSTQIGGGTFSIYNNFLQNVINGRYNKEMTKLLVDNKWQAQVAKVLADRAKSPNLFAKGLKSLIEKVGNAKIGRAASLGTAQSITNGYLPK